MIYTVTLNPAIDCLLTVDALQPGHIHRSREEQVVWGGKGINVSQTLQSLGVPSVALGFTAGFTGQALRQGLEAEGLATDFIQLAAGLTRINVKIRAAEETDVNAAGPVISEEERLALLEKMDALQAGDWLVLSGSIPPSLPKTMYAELLQRVQGRGVISAVDTAGEALRQTLPLQPFLIKPNRQELEELFSESIRTEEDVVRYARRLQQEGARHILVSMGAQGALLCEEDGTVHRIGTLKGTVVHTSGAGDAMLAGFLAGYQATGDTAYALRLGTAAGAAAAFSAGTPSGCQIRALLAQAEADL